MIKSIAVYTKNIAEDIKTIENIKAFFSQDQDIDFLIFNGADIVSTIDHAILKPYYMFHYSGIIIFLDLDSLLEYKHSIIGEPYIFITDLKTNMANKHLLNQYNILYYNDQQQMELIVNHDLRQTFKQ
jgi:hypothetical protein